GEALPSIGAVANLGITTRHLSEPHAWSLSVEAGVKSAIMPAALSQGTRVEVSDLFYATPARLKFLKTDRTEAEAIREVVRRLAMARPDVAFTLAGEERAPVTWAAALPGAAGRLTRLGDILGADFRSSAIEVRSEREGVVVEGFAAAPSLTRANALGQSLFVTGRRLRATPRQLGLATLAVLPGHSDAGFRRLGRTGFRRARTSRVRCRHAHCRCAFPASAVGRPARPSVRGGPHADPRDLYRVTDPR